MPITNQVIFRNSNGNVGIGNNSPAHTLRIEGTLSATGNANLGNIGATNGVFTNISGTLATAAQPNVTSLGTLSSLTVSGNAAFDSNTLFVDSVNDRIGIGTTTPRQKLDIPSGWIYLGASGQLQITGNPGIVGLQISGSDTAESIVGTMGAHPLVFRTNSTEKVRITSSGNVLIGTSTDDGSNRLQISGNVKLSSSAGAIIRTEDTSSGTTAAKIETGAGYTTVGTTTNHPYILATNNTEALRIYPTSQNINIGSSVSDGGFKLNVTGTGSSGTARFYDQTATTGKTSVIFRAGAGQLGTDPIVKLQRSDGTDNFYIVDDGVRVRLETSNSSGRYISFGNDRTGIQFPPAGQTLGYLSLPSQFLIRFHSGDGVTGAWDAGLARNAAGVLEINNGTAGTYRDLTARTVTVNESTLTIAKTSAPATAPTATINATAGNVSGTNIKYYVTFVTSIGETTLSPVSNTIASITNQRIDLTNIPIGSAAVTARKIYRISAAQLNAYAVFIATINDNTTTTYTDNITEPGLAVGAYNSVNTAGGISGLTYLKLGNASESGLLELNVNSNSQNHLNFYQYNTLGYSVNLSNAKFSIIAPSASSYIRLSSGNNGFTGIEFAGAGERGSITADSNYNFTVQPNDIYAGGHIFLSSNNKAGDVIVANTSTGNFKFDVAKSSANGTARFYDQTATTGATKVVIRSGAGQSSTPLLTFQDSTATNQVALSGPYAGGPILAALTAAGAETGGAFLAEVFYARASGTSVLIMDGGNSRFKAGSTSMYAFTSSTAATSTIDLGLARNAAGVLEINNGTAGTLRDLQLRAINPSSGNVGIGTTTPLTKLQINDKVTDDNAYSYDTNSLHIIHPTNTSDVVLNDPKEVLLLSRKGTNGLIYGAAAGFRISRYENAGNLSRTRLDLVLAHDAYMTSPTTAMTVLSSGRIGLGNTAPAHTLRVEGTFSTSGNATVPNISVTNIASVTNLGVNTSSPLTRLQVGVKVSDDNGYSYDSNSIYSVHQTATSTTVLNDPQEILLLARQGTPGQAYGAAASFRLCRYENSSTNSRTRLDLVLAHEGFMTSPTTAMTVLSSGRVGIGNTAPTHTLRVEGTFSASGNANVGNIGATNAVITGNMSLGNLIAGNLTLGSDALTSSHHTITIDPSTAGVGGNVIIQGNLQVTGTTTTVNSTVVEIADLNITLAKDAVSPASANNAGIMVAGANANILYSETGDKWTFNKPIDVSGSIAGTSLTVTGNSVLATTSGNVGVGTSSPAVKFHILKSSTANVIEEISRFGYDSDWGVNSLQVWSGPTYGITGVRGLSVRAPWFFNSGVEYGYQTDLIRWRDTWLKLGIDRDDNASYIPNVSLAGDQFVVKSDGNVGIGTTSPVYRFDVAKSSSGNTARFYDQTATTGVTKVVVRAGAGQSTTNLQEWQNGSGTIISLISPIGAMWASSGFYLDSGASLSLTAAGLRLRSDGQVAWANATNATNVIDTTISRNSAGVVEINNGTAGTLRDLTARHLTANRDSTITNVSTYALYAKNVTNSNLTVGIGYDSTKGGFIQSYEAGIGYDYLLCLQPNGGGLVVGGSSNGNFRFDVATSGSAGTARFYDQTATTGVTKLVVRAGAGQSTTSVMEWQNSGGSVVASVSSIGSIYSNSAAIFNGSVALGYDIAAEIQLSSTSILRWTNGALGATKDLGIARNAAGVLEVNNGTAGTLRDLIARKVTIGSTTGTNTLQFGSAGTNVVDYSGALTFQAGTGQLATGWGHTFLFYNSDGSAAAASIAGNTAGAQYVLDIARSGISGTARFYDATATTGVTKLVVRAGAGQSTTNLQEWQNNSGSVLSSVSSNGNFNGPNFIGSFGGNSSGWGANGRINSSGFLGWATGADGASGTIDSAIARNAAGILEINNGTAGTFRDLKLRTLIHENTQTTTLTYSNLTTSETAVDTSATATYRSVKYIVQATYGTDYQVSEILLIHNGTTADISEYGITHTSASPIVTYSTDVSGGNMRLLATAAAGSTTNLKIHKIGINT